MIQFNELRVSRDRKHLIIDVQIQDGTYYENVYLDKIIIDTQNTFKSTGPSAQPPLPIIDCEGTKHYRAVVDIELIADNLFFVWVTSTGDPAPDAPCGISDSYILGVTYDKYPLYLQGMSLLRSVQSCEVPDDLKDFILQNKAFDLSLKTGNYTTAIDYWNAFFNAKEVSVKSNCGCHGVFR